nr:PREDICTED: uncharacterized protein LOC105662803 isoform X3 [Megachile rotundata]
MAFTKFHLTRHRYSRLRDPDPEFILFRIPSMNAAGSERPYNARAGFEELTFRKTPPIIQLVE